MTVFSPTNSGSPYPPQRPSTNDLLPQVFGRYLLLRRLSSGGMGEIFLAKYGLAGFQKLCVIKKILPQLNDDEHFISRFVDEAQVTIQLQHSNIAQVYEVGRVDDEYFLSLEFVEGCDLRRALTRLSERRQRFPVEMALLMARDVAAGLSYAHRRKSPRGEPLGLVHCDISPPNVVVSFDGEVKVIDFGIAQSEVAETAEDPQMGFGKLGYMAPEQLVRGRNIDARTDVYAVGAVLFELLTGHRMFDQVIPDDRGLARRIVRGDAPQPSTIDPVLKPYDALVARATHIDPERRFASAAALRDALQEALVRIHPTLSSDHLGAYMGQLFADERAEMRALTARVQETDITQWEDKLAANSHHTVSFALSPMATRELHVPGVFGPGARAHRLSGSRPSARVRWRQWATSRPITAWMVRRPRILWTALSLLLIAGVALALSETRNRG